METLTTTADGIIGTYVGAFGIGRYCEGLQLSDYSDSVNKNLKYPDKIFLDMVISPTIIT